jgi:hypothetical protein
MKKYGMDLLTTSVRVYKKDWEKVAELAMQRGCNLPDAMHELLTNGNGQPRNEGTTTPELTYTVYCSVCKREHLSPAHNKVGA